MTYLLLCLIGLSLLLGVLWFISEMVRSFRDQMGWVRNVRRGAWPAEGHTLHYFTDLKRFPDEDMQ